MAVYRILNENIKNIIDYIVTNDELRLLLGDSGKDALSNSPSSIGIKELMENHIYPYANLSEPEDNQKSFICIYLWNAKNSGKNNVYQRDTKLFVDIICHEKIWTMDDGLIRPLLLLDDLDTQIPEIETKSIRGSFVYLDTNYIHYNDKFCGYRLIYSITNSSKGCSN